MVIKILCHRHWEQMGVDPKVLPFLCIFPLSVMEYRLNLTRSQNLSNFCARDFGVTKICNVYAYDLRNKEIKTGGGSPFI